MARWRGLIIQLVLLSLAALELVLAIVGLPRAAAAVSFYDVPSMVGFFIYLIAGGLLPFGMFKVLQQRPFGWVWMIAANVLWFSWAGLSIDFLQELIGIL